MKTNKGFTTWKTTAIVALAAMAGYGITCSITALAASPPVSKGGIDDAMDQARQLLVELRNADWNRDAVDPDLLMLPEQATVGAWQNLPGADSFVVDQRHAQYEEVAFYSMTFVDKSFVVVPGQEHVVTTTGFFIVGWKDGRVETVDVSDVRMFSLGGVDNPRIPVFPGMDEYDSNLEPFR